MGADLQKLAPRYEALLREFAAKRSEDVLNRGYELARGALVEGCGALELAAIHHQALRRLMALPADADARLDAAGSFLAECLSPFEMSHRGAQEGTRALRHLNEVLENELKRIAHALHDEAGQMLASVHIVLADIAGDLPAAARRRFGEVDQLLRQVDDQLRDLSHELRPTVLDNLGLVPALEFLAEKVGKRTGLAIAVSAEAQSRLPPAVETALYRVVQEALNNAAKHAHARSVVIDVQLAPGKVSCSVRDDGRGFAVPAAGASPGLGLMGIRERLGALGGALRIVTRPQQGSTLFAEIPLGD
jgi:two-component system sensor histidine kinase UhpB